MKNIIIIILILLLCGQHVASAKKYSDLHNDYMNILQAIEENIL